MLTDFPIHTLEPSHYPAALKEIPQVPEKLYCRGAPIDTARRMIAIVGTRRYSAYGRQACEKIITDLASYPITIVSGLAIGIDGIAHQTALNTGLTTIAVIGSGLDEKVLYPSTHRTLAKQIVEHGGTLLSELEPHTRGAKHTFPSRNRIMAGLAEIVIAIECAERSGTRITTRLATDYNKEVGAVPHSIFSETGAGTNALLREGAHCIRSGQDIVELLGLEHIAQQTLDLHTLTDNEQKVYSALTNPKTKTDILQEIGLPAHTLSATLAGLEMKGLIVETLGTIQRTQAN
ncbi:MAG: DNA-processing protein DprA [Candidatus Kaiserbacteria bacterium]|nr:DNA-processing protein DprA [Candidatus Kaiserbacteria bacterium]